MCALTNPTVAQPVPSHARLAQTQDQPSAVGAAPLSKFRRSRSARGVVSGSDGYYQTAPAIRQARAAATPPATLCALPNRAVHPDSARTHRHGRDCVARPRAPTRARRHQPLPHPLGACGARHRMVAELHSALHRPFQASASTRPVGRACPPQRPKRSLTDLNSFLAVPRAAPSLGAISRYPRGDSARHTDALRAGEGLDVGRGEAMAIKQTASTARVGDWIEARGLHGHPSRRGEIVELLGSANHEHYRVRWDAKHESIVYPADGVIITSRRTATLGALAEESD